MSSNISQITIERVEFFPPFPVARIKDLNRFFVSFKSTNQPHFHCTLYSNCIVYTVFTGASRSQESFPAANNSFLTLLLAELSPSPWQSTSSQGQASQTASDWILLSGEQSVCSQLEGTGSIWSSHKAILLHFSTCFCELLPMKLLKKATGSIGDFACEMSLATVYRRSVLSSGLSLLLLWTRIKKKAFSSGSFSPMKGNWGCHAESCRNVTDRHVWCNSVLSLCCDHGGSVDVHMGDVRLFTLL